MGELPTTTGDAVVDSAGAALLSAQMALASSERWSLGLSLFGIPGNLPLLAATRREWQDGPIGGVWSIGLLAQLRLRETEKALRTGTLQGTSRYLELIQRQIEAGTLTKMAVAFLERYALELARVFDRHANELAQAYQCWLDSQQATW